MTSESEKTRTGEPKFKARRSNMQFKALILLLRLRCAQHKVQITEVVNFQIYTMSAKVRLTKVKKMHELLQPMREFL